MAELRSFVIGVAIAAGILGIAAVAFGAFGGDDDGSPGIVLLGSPAASDTQAPAPTREPSEPDGESTQPPSLEETPTPEAEQEPEPEQEPDPETEPTVAPTEVSEPEPEPTVEPVSDFASYAASASPLTESLVGQLVYLAGNASAPAIDNPDWNAFTLQAAQAVTSLAGSINALQPPPCAAGAHGTLAASAGQASQAASNLIAAVNAGDAAGVSATAGALAAANQAVSDGVAAVNAAAC